MARQAAGSEMQPTLAAYSSQARWSFLNFGKVHASSKVR